MNGINKLLISPCCNIFRPRRNLRLSISDCPGIRGTRFSSRISRPRIRCPRDHSCRLPRRASVCTALCSGWRHHSRHHPRHHSRCSRCPHRSGLARWHTSRRTTCRSGIRWSRRIGGRLFPTAASNGKQEHRWQEGVDKQPPQRRPSG